MQFIKGQNQQLENYLSSHPYSSLWHTSDWLAFQTKNGNPGIYFGVVDNNEIIAAGILQLRHRSVFKFGYIQGGILYTENRLNSELYTVIINGLKEIAVKNNLII